MYTYIYAYIIHQGDAQNLHVSRARSRELRGPLEKNPSREPLESGLEAEVQAGLTMKKAGEPPGETDKLCKNHGFYREKIWRHEITFYL